MINSSPVSSLSHYNTADLGGNPPYKLIENGGIPSGYVDITSLLNWDRFKLDIKRDNLFIRDRLIEHFGTEVDVDLLSVDPDSGRVCSQYMLGNIVDRVVLNGANLDNLQTKTLTLTDQLAIKTVTEENASATREAILSRNYRMVIAQAAWQLNYSDTLESTVLNLAFSPVGDLLSRYLNYGVTGSTISGPKGKTWKEIWGLFDYIYSTKDSPFEKAGLAEHFETQGVIFTIPEFQANLYDILVVGNYDYEES